MTPNCSTYFTDQGFNGSNLLLIYINYFWEVAWTFSHFHLFHTMVTVVWQKLSGSLIRDKIQSCKSVQVHVLSHILPTNKCLTNGKMWEEAYFNIKQ